MNTRVQDSANQTSGELDLQGQGADPESNNSGNGQSGQGEQDIQKLIQEAVEKETTGLKNKNNELIGKLKRYQEQLKPWEGLDPKQVRDLVNMSNQSEEAKLIAEGKLEEVVNKKIQGRLEQYNSKIDELSEQVNVSTQESEKWRNLYNDSIVKNFIANNVRGLQDAALSVVQRIASDWLTVEDGIVVASENAPIGAKGKLKPDQIQDYLVENYQYFFKPSTGGGAQIGQKGYNMHTPRSKMTTEQKVEFMRKARELGRNPQEEYFKLPE